jgi:hypothetical protein
VSEIVKGGNPWQTALFKGFPGSANRRGDIATRRNKSVAECVNQQTFEALLKEIKE